MGEEGEGKGKGKVNKPVTSYTPSSIMIYIPSSGVLCAATSAIEKDFDILASVACLLYFPFPT